VIRRSTCVGPKASATQKMRCWISSSEGGSREASFPVREPHPLQFGASPLQAGTLLFRTAGVQGSMS
jgi:hypothetical protein